MIDWERIAEAVCMDLYASRLIFNNEHPTHIVFAVDGPYVWDIHESQLLHKKTKAIMKPDKIVNVIVDAFRKEHGILGV